MKTKFSITLFALFFVFGSSTSYAQWSGSNVADQAPIILKYTGNSAKGKVELFVMVSQMNSSSGYLKIGDELDSLKYGSFDSEGEISLDLKSGKTIEGKHKGLKTAKVKLLNESGKKELKIELEAVPAQNEFDGMYKAKNSKDFTNESGVAILTKSENEIYFVSYWERTAFLNDAKKGKFSGFEGVMKKVGIQSDENLAVFKYVFFDLKGANQVLMLSVELKEGKYVKNAEINLWVESSRDDLPFPNGISKGEKIQYVKK